MSKLLSISIVGFFLILISGCQSKESNTPPGQKLQILQIQQEISTDSIEANVQKLVGFYSDSVGVSAAREWIYDRFQKYSMTSNNRLKVKYDRYTDHDNQRILEPTEIVNVIAVLPGTQLESKDRTYLVSGHYDSRLSEVQDDTGTTPAADDASVTAAVLEMARVMSKYEFDATIVFAVFAGEEQGLIGARHFAETSSRRNIDISGMITNDIIGNRRKNTNGSVNNKVNVFAQGVPANEELSDYHRMLLSTGGENDTPSRQLGRYFYRISNEHVKDVTVDMIYRRDRYLQGGDHVAFLEQGYPAVRVSESYSRDRQDQEMKKTDSLQHNGLSRFVDYSYVTNVTRLNASVLTSLANAPAKPIDVGIEVKQPENNTNLQWKANNEPDLKGYEIVWRQTHEPYWQDSIFVGDTTRYTLKGISKDNYIFGVRSVDQFGHKSLVMYPVPLGSQNND